MLLALSAPPVWDPYVNATLRLGPPGPDGRRPWALGPDELGPEEGELLLDLGALQAAGQDVEAPGRALGEAIWADRRAELLASLLETCRQEAGGLRLWLELDDPALDAVAWERMFHPTPGGWAPLATSQMVLLCRRVSGSASSAREAPGRARALALVASPTNLGAVGLSAIPPEEAARAVAALRGAELGELRVLGSGGEGPPTIAALTAALQGGVDVLHVLAHGSAGSAGPALLLEDDEGRLDPLPLTRLIEIMSGLGAPPRLVFLAACESAGRPGAGGRLSMGEGLVRHGGVGACVAMSGLVGIDAAQDFTAACYARLAVHGLLDLAVQEARAAVREHRDWGAPVLFSALSDNRLLRRSMDRVAEGLSWLGRGFQALSRAMEPAHFDPQAQGMVDAMEALLDELKASRETLSGWVHRLARVGMDPEGYAERLRALHAEFSLFAATGDFDAARTRCTEVARLYGPLAPRLRDALPPEDFEELDSLMRLLSEADFSAVDFIPAFVDELAGALDGMVAALDAGEVERAIADGRAFTLKAGAALRENRRLFEQMRRQVMEMAEGAGMEEMV